MLSVERRETIHKILREKKSVGVTELAQYLNVSSETIRRDLDAMEKQGLLKKIYGGAVIKDAVTTSASSKILETLFVEEKQAIAKTAASFIRPGECIFLDHSTTVGEICQFIKDIPLTIMTNSLKVINYFSESSNIRLVIPGGNYNPTFSAITGLETIHFLQRHNLDKSFFSCRTLDLKNGLGEADENIAELRRNIILSTKENYLLVDHTKLNRVAFLSNPALEQIDYIITDDSLPEEWPEKLNELQVQYIECNKIMQ